MTEISEIGVVGAGFMGSGIAESAARAGIVAHVFEPDEAPLRRSREGIEASVARRVRGGKLEAPAARELVERVHWTSDLDELGSSEIVVEAIVEDEAAKAEVFRALDELVGDKAILASNTSSIPIAGLAAATSRPDRVVGLHFFSPVPVMKLVEIVVGLGTAPETVARVEGFAAQIGQTAIKTKD